MKRKKIEEALAAKVIEKEGKKFIPCPAALKIAETLNVPAAEIGKICNEMKIKIMSCRLGCF